MKTIITYNNGFGKVNADFDGEKYIITRASANRAWKKISDPNNGFGGGAELIFDTDRKVISIDVYRVYKSISDK